MKIDKKLIKYLKGNFRERIRLQQISQKLHLDFNNLYLACLRLQKQEILKINKLTQTGQSGPYDVEILQFIPPEGLNCKHPLLVYIGYPLTVALVIFGLQLWDARSQLKEENKKLRTKIETKDVRILELTQKLSDKNTEIQRLETQLTPFKTIALEKYTGSEKEALKELAQNLKVIENKTAVLEKQLTPRKLTQEQISIIAEKIRSIKGIKVHFLLIASDPEAKSFKNQIKEVLEKGGWIIEKDLIALAGAFEEITLFASQDPPSKAVQALYSSLKKFGFEVLLIRDINLPEDVIYIKIGKKNDV
ncbi:MAG: hypothetical protein KAI72_01625 [Candidatus Pacebacteria bacterium]|nr:hypothetical protein [Candidatus Paceibacterota bacterium]